MELSVRSMVAVLLLVAIVELLGKLLPVLLMLVTALMLVGALNPLVAALEARKIGRKIGISIVITTAVGGLALLLLFTVPPLLAQTKSIIRHEPEIRAQLVARLQRSELMRTLGDDLNNMQYDQLLKSSGSTVLNATKQVFEVIAYGIGSVFLAVYVMLDRDRLRGAVFAVMPRSHHIRFSRVVVNMEAIVGGYIRGQIITCISMSVFILVLLLICRVPNALALAVFGGAIDLLPYIGVFLAIAPTVAAAYAVGPAIALTVFLLMLAYEEFESRVLVPVVYGRSMRLPSSVVFVSLIVGWELGGIVGSLLSLPLAAAVLILVEELRVELPGETIQAEDLAVLRKDQREERDYERRTEGDSVEAASAVAVKIARVRKAKERGAKKDAAANNPPD